MKINFWYLHVYPARSVYCPLFHDSFVLKPNLTFLCLMGYPTLSSGSHMYILLYSCRKSANNNNGNESTGSDEESTTSETSHKYKDLIKVNLLY